jgi:hypothetical protein
MHDERFALAREIRRHAATHVAKTDESNARHFAGQP